MSIYYYLSTHLSLLCLLTALFGLIIGSFLSVVVARYPIILRKQWRAECREYLELPTERLDKFSLTRPRSHCPHCKTPIKAWHNIPILGYLIQRCQCAHCKERISVKYLLIELTSAILSVLVLLHFGISWQALTALYFTYTLIALFFIDIDSKLLPDTLTITTLWVGLIINTFYLFTPLDDAVLSAAFAYVLLWGTAWSFMKLRGKQGMGHGDFKMLAMVAAWFGFYALMNTLLIAVVLGLLAGISLITLKKIGWKNTIPFGPYIALGAWTSMMAGPLLLTWLSY